WLCAVCFVFQAEDGIRDPLVTGVQTCALPIFEIALNFFIGSAGVVAGRHLVAVYGPDGTPVAGGEKILPLFLRRRRRDAREGHQIGRASCRERLTCTAVEAGWSREFTRGRRAR